MAKKELIPAGKLTLKLTTKTVWAGTYGGHYDIIVFFCRKPKLSEETDRYGRKFYELIEQDKEIIVGDMSLGDFKALFPTCDISAFLQEDGRPKECEIYEVFKVKLTTYWEDGKMASIDCNSDGWSRR